MKADTLHGAAKLGDAGAAAILLADGAQVDAKDARGITALGVAVGFNKIAVIKALLAAGADVRLTDAKGNTPLHYAAGACLCTASSHVGACNIYVSPACERSRIRPVPSPIPYPG